ncbi:Twin-arginine translocation protein TatA [hydrothermal vent metagenome]|uniref:Twin-arginine translocation protein TatA n=1 Tax=hydrothermal vent metagenome TaxID=652676 RepID=A0A1W1C5J8_9ZZZZ
MGMPGGYEWVIILAVVLILFGGKKIPELAKGLGKGIRNFKDEMKDTSSDEVAQASTPKVEQSETTATNSETTKNTTTQA